MWRAITLARSTTDWAVLSTSSLLALACSVASTGLQAGLRMHLRALTKRELSGYLAAKPGGPRHRSPLSKRWPKLREDTATRPPQTSLAKRCNLSVVSILFAITASVNGEGFADDDLLPPEKRVSNAFEPLRHPKISQQQMLWSTPREKLRTYTRSFVALPLLRL